MTGGLAATGQVRAEPVFNILFLSHAGVALITYRPSFPAPSIYGGRTARGESTVVHADQTEPVRDQIQQKDCVSVSSEEPRQTATVAPNPILMANFLWTRDGTGTRTGTRTGLGEKLSQGLLQFLHHQQNNNKTENWTDIRGHSALWHEVRIRRK